jgi:uncharacterized protein (TIGR04141 family)
VLDCAPRPPWWKNFWGIEQDLQQVLKGAILFLPISGRCFALTFGHTYHNLKEDCYEYNFGLRVTLNSLDPEKLKSTDTVEPGISRRQRIQSPTHSDLTYFDFDKDSSIIKGLTGKVKDEHKEFFNHATGASNLRISSKVEPDKIKKLCQKALEIYNKDDYKKAFSGIQNIVPIKDPIIIKKLNDKLLKAFKEKAMNLALTIPELIDYQDAFYITFSGVGSGLVYEDVSMSYYHDYLSGNNKILEEVTIDQLKKNQLILCNEDGYKRKEFSILKCLLFDTFLDGQNHTYHLCEGNWYQVDNKFIETLKNYLNPYFEEFESFIAYNHKSEEAYNSAVAENNSRFICLDRKNIAPSGQTSVEPCDLYIVEENKAVLIHVKRSTRSSQLSHLFNQGVNAVELIKLEEQSKELFQTLVRSNLNGNNEKNYTKAINNKVKVVYAIITHKDKANKSDNLPLFSRVSLMRNVKSLTLMGADVSVCFIKDESQNKEGRNKERKKRRKTGEMP